MADAQLFMTANDLLRTPRGRARFELVRGELREYPLRGCQEGVIVATVACALRDYVQKQKLGHVAIGGGFLIHRNPDTVRSADVGFVPEHRVPEGGREGYVPGPPDLVVEVVPFNRPEGELKEKVTDWLEAGTRFVAVVNPPRRSVAVFRPGQHVVFHRDGEILDAGDVIPGWSIPLAEIFA